MDARFPESPGVHDAIECPAVLCVIPARQPHPQSKNGLPLRCHAGASRLPQVLATPFRPTHKAGYPGIGKVLGAFFYMSLFWEQSEQFPVFRLRQEAIEFPQHGLF